MKRGDRSTRLWCRRAARKFYKATQVTLDGLESKPSDAVSVE